MKGTTLAITGFAAAFAIAATAAGQQPLPPNDHVTVPDDTLLINEICIDGPGGDANEFFELMGPVGMSLDNHWYIVIGDTDDEERPLGGSGVIEEAIDLTGRVIPERGYFMACEPFIMDTPPDLTLPLNFEQDDNVTHMIVRGFKGTIGDDVDLNDDGFIDTPLWLEVLHSVSLIKEPDPDGFLEEHFYGQFVVGPREGTTPAHVYRCTEPIERFLIGQFEGGDATPGEPNFCLNADVDGDGIVGVNDMLAVLAAWGAPCDGCPEDVDGNGKVTVEDLLVVLGQWF